MNPKKQGLIGRVYCYCKQIKPPKTMKQKLEKSYLVTKGKCTTSAVRENRNEKHHYLCININKT